MRIHYVACGDLGRAFYSLSTGRPLCNINGHGVNLYSCVTSQSADIICYGLETASQAEMAESAHLRAGGFAMTTRRWMMVVAVVSLILAGWMCLKRRAAFSELADENARLAEHWNVHRQRYLRKTTWTLNAICLLVY
jgi:hypothetical protein